MIDPIQAAAINRLTTDPPRRAELAKKEGAEPSAKPGDPRLKLNQPASHDAVALNFNLQGDLHTLRQSVQTVFDQVKTQLEEVFKITGRDEAGDAEQFLLPEEASAQEILDFFSPQNTADRIVNFATGFFDVFAQTHPQQGTAENVEAFSSLITNAVEKGFNQAKALLSGLQDKPEVGQNIEKTFQLVLEGIEEFRTEFIKRLDIPAVDPEAQPDPLEERLEEKQKASAQIKIEDSEPQPERQNDKGRKPFDAVN